MKKIINNLTLFINEQRLYYSNNFQPISKIDWAQDIWPGGFKAVGWLNSATKIINLNFKSTKRMLGFPEVELERDYIEFCKSMLVCSYRIKNGCSPQALLAELLTLKRWYVVLKEETTQSKPYLLSSEIIHKAMLILTDNSSGKNLPDLCGNSVRLQDIINRRTLTLTPLMYVNPHNYTNQHNSNVKLQNVKHAKSQDVIDDINRDNDKLISIHTFLNLLKLKSLVVEPSEKILMYATMLLIVTGFRSIELFLIKIDALIKREMVDPVTKQFIFRDGKPIYYLGIRYFGVKGSSHRIHWVEPLAVPLVEQIFSEIQLLTAGYRDHIKYLRDNKFKTYLPKSLVEMQEDPILIDDFFNELIDFKITKSIKSYSRDVATQAFQRRGLLPVSEKANGGNRIARFYQKSDIDRFLKNLAPIKDYILNFNYEGNKQSIPIENFLFIIPLGSNNYFRTLTHKTTYNILNNAIFNKWLGGSTASNKSVFEWYELKESNGNFSSMRSHVPRHNINTFLALTGLSETLQAMMMGRTDLKQNQHYQHLAVLELKKAAQSIVPDTSHSIISVENTTDIVTKADGTLFFSEGLDLEQNLKRNFHTFDGPSDVAKFLKSIANSNDPFGDAFLQDFKAGLAESSDNDDIEKTELLETHAHFYPVLNGTCMRDIRKDGCPARLKCLSGSGCCNFVVTGRKGELENLTKLKQSLEKSVEQVSRLADVDPRYKRALIEQTQNLANTSIAIEKTLIARNQLTTINVFPNSADLSGIGGKPKTLVDLFAAEQIKIDIKKAEKMDDDK